MIKSVFAVLLVILPTMSVACRAPSHQERFFFKDLEEMEKAGEVIAKVEILSFEGAYYETGGYIPFQGKRRAHSKLTDLPIVEFRVVEFIKGSHQRTIFRSSLNTLSTCVSHPTIDIGTIAYASGHFEDGEIQLQSFRRKY